MQYSKPFHCVQIELLVLDFYTWNYLTVCKQMSSNFIKNKVTYELFT